MQAVHFVLDNFYSQTGKDLSFKDEKELEESILFEMSDPNKEWIKALEKFKHKTLISSPHHDMAVPFSSAGITSNSSYPLPTDTFDMRVYGANGFDPSYFENNLIPEPLFNIEHNHDHENSSQLLENKMSFDLSSHVMYPSQVLKNLQTIEKKKKSIQF